MINTNPVVPLLPVDETKRNAAYKELAVCGTDCDNIRDVLGVLISQYQKVEAAFKYSQQQNP